MYGRAGAEIADAFDMMRICASFCGNSFCYCDATMRINVVITVNDPSSVENI